MCGIVGFYNLDGRPVDPDILVRMAKCLGHRGPDDRGMRLFSLARGQSVEWIPGEPVLPLEGAIGFNRLSILDVSMSGHQPMCNDDESVFLAFNGEIYNAFNYKLDLEKAGYTFRSHTDTEIVLRLYERFGLKTALSLMNGMFALAVVDMRSRALHLSRDQFGVKPLYWACQRNTLFFASEVKAFLEHPDFEVKLNEDNTDEYMAFRYCASDRHLICGVRQLPPGHNLSCHFGNEPKVWRYFSIQEETEQYAISRSEAVEEAEQRLRQSVKSQLLSDVKVGCQLSGGIDSSLVTLFASSQSEDPIESFSVVFSDPKYSEDHWVKQAAAIAGTYSHRFMFEDDFFVDNLDLATWHLDQPINHPNSLGIFLLAKRSRGSVTVLLSGEGADELLGGYDRFYFSAIRSRIGPLMPFATRLPWIGKRYSSILDVDFPDEIDNFISASMFQRPGQLAQLRPNADLSGILARRRATFDEGSGTLTRKCIAYEMQTYMVDLLVRQDKMTMAHSIENRVPFLDRDFVSFARALPTNLLVDDRLCMPGHRTRHTKVLLKDVARRIFDDEFVYRPKSGFSLPLHHFFQQKRFCEKMQDQILPGIKSRGVVDYNTMQRWWQNVSRLEPAACEPLWISIAFEVWAQQFLGRA